ncbi:MAG TPA: NAD(P)-dependent oxidoreductase [Verrucomicrobiae bacterium]|nr:NAD(P)-dependent oxidoreductase [Verrucomicrobiae bacterium]
MRIFLAGATGALGKRLVALLVSSGHHVTGMTRSTGKVHLITQMGAEPAVADALDRAAVMDAVMTAQPDVVVHQVTALVRMGDLKHFDREFALTNRLRTEGTQYLLAAAKAAGASRFVAQSFSGWPNSRTGGRVKTEEDPLDAHPPKSMRRTLEAIRQLEQMVTSSAALTGVVLRYGGLYGPGTSIGPGGYLVEMIRRRRLPIVGEGTGVWSFLHIDDAANATRIAIEDGPAGVYNVVDDEPAEVSKWLPELAATLGARPPRRIPAWIGRLLIGEAGLSMMNDVRGSSNAKARTVLGWRPFYATWREGFRSGADDRILSSAAAQAVID